MKDLDSLPPSQRIIVGSILLVSAIVGQTLVCVFAVWFPLSGALANVTGFLIAALGRDMLVALICVLLIITAGAYWGARKYIELPDCWCWQVVTIIGAVGYLVYWVRQ